MAEHTERDGIIEERVQLALEDGLTELTATEVIHRALVDSGALYFEEAEEVAGGVAVYLERAGKLADRA